MSRWTLDERNHHQWWWIPLAVVVMAVATWGVLGMVEGSCVRGPSGGCSPADGHELRWWLMFLSYLPTFFVVGTGATTHRWPPAVGVALGGAGGAVYALTQGRTTAYVVTASILLALAVLAPVQTWRRQRRTAVSP
ncbi:hypothetical protein ACIGEZ_03725 [Streptomyces sp. NPDC085481]|uniref:hypothetical protein n=1 Tax=Streptomyces sp. NPDC085481 TaxID=3365727 RepID=UPI0037CD6F2F